jgi:predicted protein tyrosine phosphatase
LIKVLFVCSQNKLRSPTAEQVFSGYAGIECESAGVDDSAQVPLSAELVQWADVIIAMEASHRAKIARKFSRYLDGKRVVVAGIPDHYKYMEPALVGLLEAKVPPLLQGRTNSRGAKS